MQARHKGRFAALALAFHALAFGTIGSHPSPALAWDDLVDRSPNRTAATARHTEREAAETWGWRQPADENKDNNNDDKEEKEGEDTSNDDETSNAECSVWSVWNCYPQ